MWFPMISCPLIWFPMSFAPRFDLLCCRSGLVCDLWFPSYCYAFFIVYTDICYFEAHRGYFFDWFMSYCVSYLIFPPHLGFSFLSLRYLLCIGGFWEFWRWNSGNFCNHVPGRRMKKKLYRCLKCCLLAIFWWSTYL